MTVRTRFAPSPTGYLHIGGVRTALFNWLFARRHGGQFVLRIDDTDEQRNVQAALQPILDGFRWLGLDWDEGPDVGGPFAPYRQSARGASYAAAVQRLLQQGAAYYDFARPEELQRERELAEQARQSFVYSRRWMAVSESERAAWEAEGRNAVVRLKMPREGKLVIPDLIRGAVEIEWVQEQDHVIQRADGSCLYHLATVVDDYDFQITHVIRAEEHLSNTARQIFMAQQLGYPLPHFAHIPFVAEPGSKTKLSKRKLGKYLKNRDFKALNDLGQRVAERLHLATTEATFNPVLVDFYEQVGFLPDAIVNYLLLLGWSLDDRSEDFTRDQMVRHFSLERVNKAPASFDPQRLMSFQERYMQRLPIKQKVARVLPFLQRAGWVASPPPCDTGPYLTAILSAAGDRIKVAGEILDYRDFFVDDEQLSYDPQAWEKRMVREMRGPGLLSRFRQVLAEVEPFTPPELERAMQEFLVREQAQMGDMIHALRVAITGKSVGFGMFDTLAILGRERCLRRLEQALQRRASGPLP